MCVYVRLNYNLLTTMAVRLSLFTNCNTDYVPVLRKKTQKSTVQFHGETGRGLLC